MSDDWLVDLTFDACPDNLGPVRRLVAARAAEVGCGETLVQQLVLVVDEACANIIRHGYRGDERGRIRLRLGRTGGQLDFYLEDECDPVDPACLKPRSLDECRPGGLGLAFIDQVMDAWEFLPPASGKRGNVLHMSRRIE